MLINGKYKIFVLSGPSGVGKSTIIKNLIKRFNNIEFSISATNRKPRDEESNLVDYYFFTTEEFVEKIKNDEFIEYEEVYQGCYYGTLKSEVERICKNGHHIILDLSVKGAYYIKKIYKNRSLLIFISPPSIEILLKRMENRSPNMETNLESRRKKIQYVMSQKNRFDTIITNDLLSNTIDIAENEIRDFLRI